MTQILPTDTERKLISENLSADIRALALKLKPAQDLRPKYILQQIAGYQTMRRKMPQWADCEGFVYPVHLSLEQCSSADTAQYKRKIVERICQEYDTFADLTAGFGVDFYTMSEGFQKAFYIERNEELCEIARHNFTILGRQNFEVLNQDGVDFLSTADGDFDTIYLDPARRDSHGGKTVHIEDCAPNVAELQEQLLEKSKCTIIKLSPMLDISECLLKIKNISEIHVVASGGECKEILLVLTHDINISEPTIYAVSNGDIITFTKSSEMAIITPLAEKINPGQYLYEPNAAIMKAGCYKTVAEDFNVKAVHKNSHLYVSEELVDNFPGRKFQIVRIGAPKDFKDLKKANIAVRNYPIKPDDLRKKMKLQDGGEVYLFATTIAGDRKVVVECRKV